VHHKKTALNVFAEEDDAMQTPRALGAASLLILAAACARAAGPAAAPAPMVGADDSSPGSRSIGVQVDNQNFSDMNVYLVSGGSRWLLGVVNGLTKATLSIPAGLAPADQRVRLTAEGIGGGSATTTPTLIVPPGQQIYWTIGSDPAVSTASAG
jgi:hypothetical protein